MQSFEMQVANTCSECGKMIAKGEQVFADNFDEVRSGVGVCATCAGKEEEQVRPTPLDYEDLFDPLVVEKLNRAGFQSVAAINEAPDDVLLDVSGIGPATVEDIRNAIADA